MSQIATKKKVINLVNEIINLMRINNKSHITISYVDFYKLAKMKRFHESFFADLKQELEALNILFAKGKFVVAFTYDSLTQSIAIE